MNKNRNLRKGKEVDPPKSHWYLSPVIRNLNLNLLLNALLLSRAAVGF